MDAQTVARAVLPHGIVAAVQRRRAAVAGAEDAARQQRDRKARLTAAATRRAAGEPVRWDQEEAFAFLVARGLAEEEVREGSVPEASLKVCREAIARELPGDRPLVALHVGNFVGVSLCAVAAALRDRHPGSVLVGVDPDISHRGVAHPAGHVMALVHRFALEENVLLVPAFSMAANLGNDGFDRWDGAADPRADVGAPVASARALPALRTLAPAGFDLAMLDGNHDADYLAGELAEVAGLLRPDGLLVLDDVQEGMWGEIQDAFDGLFAGADQRFRRLAADGRVGLAARTGA